MLEHYKGYGLRSFYMIFAMSDETVFRVDLLGRAAGRGGQGLRSLFFISPLLRISSTGWPARGWAQRSAPSCPSAPRACDFVMTAMFTVIFLNQWEKDKQHYSALIGIAAPYVLMSGRVFGSGSFRLAIPWRSHSGAACRLCVQSTDKAEDAVADRRTPRDRAS